jgi:hypothetical protein
LATPPICRFPISITPGANSRTPARPSWATTLVTHACDLTEDVLTQLHKLQRVVVTGSAVVDEAVCAARGVRVTHLPPGGSGAALIAHLEADPVR